MARMSRGEAAGDLNRYVRDDGLVAWEIDLLDAPHLPGLNLTLLGHPLAWAWRAEWRPSGRDTDAWQRPPQLVTQETISELLEDAAWRDADGYGRWILLVAMQPGWWNRDPATLDEAVTTFAARCEGAVEALVLQIGDAQHDLAFVPERSHPEVAAFMDRVRPPAAAYRTLPYRRLYTASMEAQLGLDRRLR